MGQKTLYNPSNLITFSRIMLAFFAVYLLLLGNAMLYLVAMALIIVAISLDYIDGLVARRFNYATKFGGVFDIIADRTIENILWIVFAYIKLIPLWIPLVVVSRSFVTDGFRSYAFSRGKDAFGKNTMMNNDMGILFVSSRFSRVLYATAKAAAFSMLALQLYLIEVSYPNIGIFKDFTYSLVLFTVAFCIIRGLFVVYDGFRMFVNNRTDRIGCK